MRKPVAVFSLMALLAAGRPGASLAAEDAAPLPAAGAFSEENLQFDFALGLLRRNLYAEAVTEFRKFLTLHPGSARAVEALRLRGDAAYGQHDYAAAAADYYQFLQKKPELDIPLRLRYAICLYELKRPGDTLQTLHPLLPLTEQEENRAHAPAVNYYLALALRDTGDAAGAAKHFQTVADIPEPSAFTPLALYALGESNRKQRQHELAAACFARLAKEFPAHELASAARLAESDALRQGGMRERSIARFRELVNSPDGVIRARARYGLAGALAEAGIPEEAALHAQEVLNDPAAGEFHDGARYLLAAQHFAMQKYAEAAQEADRVNPDGQFAEGAAVTRAWALYRLGRFPEAAARAQQGMEKYPNNEDFPYLAGRALWETQKYAEAADAFTAARDRALKIQGKRGESAALEAAMAWEKAGRPEEAVTLYQWLQQHYPDGATKNDRRCGLGRALMAAGRHEAALPVWEDCARDTAMPKEKQESALFQQAAAYYYLKQYGNLRTACTRLLELFPDGKNAPDALYWLAWRDMEDKLYENALNRYREFGKRHPQHKLAPKARYYAGAALLKLGREDETATAFYEIVRDGGALEGRELLWLAAKLGERPDTAPAEEIFAQLLQRKEDPMLRTVARLGRAKLRRRQQKWDAAIADSRAALAELTNLDAKAEVSGALANEANFGLAVALRENGQLALAEKTLDAVRVAPDDPFTAQLHFERGSLALAAGKHAEAAELLLRVGLLSADEELAGKALWLAAEACTRNGDAKRARICYDELSGTAPGTFGALHPQNSLVARAKEELAKLPAAPERP